jgi:AcrR family transcriptional regulator
VARTAGSTAEATRQRILDAASELFVERGFAGTSIRDLAVQVGMTKAALYYHFPSKEEMLEALLAPFLDEIDRIIVATATGQWTRAELVSRLIGQLNEQGDFLYAVLGDPSVKHAMFERLNLPLRMASLIRVMAGSDEPTAMLRSRCAMGALMSGLLGDPGTHATRPQLSVDDQHTICSAVLAVLGLEDPRRPGAKTRPASNDKPAQPAATSSNASATRSSASVSSASPITSGGRNRSTLP